MPLGSGSAERMGTALRNSAPAHSSGGAGVGKRTGGGDWNQRGDQVSGGGGGAGGGESSTKTELH